MCAYIIGKSETNCMKGASIGEFEELVLLAVGMMSEQAYGLAVLDELENKTGRTIMISAVHKTLVRLEEKGYLRSRMGGATATRGGRDKRLYTLTQSGITMINQSRDVRNSMWKQIPKMIWQGN